MLGNKLGASKITISKNVATLSERWYITIEVKNSNERKITLVKNDKGDSQKWQGGIVENDNPLYIYNITNEYIIQKFYGVSKYGADEKKSNKLIDAKLKQWITLEDMWKCMVLYNNECRINWEWDHLMKLETWLERFQKPTDEQIEDRLTSLIKQHKQKKKSDEKYSKSKKAKTLRKELCDTFWKDRVNEIYKNESTGGITLNFT